ncbi:protein-export chaperone SecB [Simiduia curdlanivorans]|uniref:Protein-export protein SecB n=1 Tax=Simiduia curdlanivorans TaxID=1492769 RepID=A0ABV8V419_9GAMM|nr:protein-export chaperone SecB [Simiduia curdlanivorans]MDN3637409.1 protein-export chaperone SecB [Simiduia curdlanivorans]
MTEETNTGAAAATETPAAAQQFALQRVYLKDLSFESPMGVKAFMKEWKPAVNQELNTKAAKIDAENYEVVLTLTITVSIGEETAFLVEVQQAGLFHINGLPEQALPQLLNTACPQILFPYAREAVDSIVVKGSFPALMLPPVNFDALFAHAVQQAKAQQAGAKEAATEQ